MHFHSYPFEFAGNQILLDVWHQLSQKIQLSFVMSQVIVRDVDFIGTNERYVEIALGEDLDKMLCEIDIHLEMGVAAVKKLMKGIDAGFAARRLSEERISSDAIADCPTTDYGFDTADAGSQIRAGGLSRREKAMRQVRNNSHGKGECDDKEKWLVSLVDHTPQLVAGRRRCQCGGGHWIVVDVAPGARRRRHIALVVAAIVTGAT